MKVKAFDITKILHPKFWSYVDGSKIGVAFDGLIIFQKINDLISELNKLKKKIVFIDMLGVGIIENRIRKIAKTHGVVVKLNLGSIPSPQISSIWEKISLLRRPIVLAHTLKKFLKKSFVKILSKKYYPDYFVIAGSALMAGVNKRKYQLSKLIILIMIFFLKKKTLNKTKTLIFLYF